GSKRIYNSSNNNYSNLTTSEVCKLLKDHLKRQEKIIESLRGKKDIKALKIKLITLEEKNHELEERNRELEEKKRELEEELENKEELEKRNHELENKINDLEEKNKTEQNELTNDLNSLVTINEQIEEELLEEKDRNEELMEEIAKLKELLQKA
ncbi:5052_t:CDS:2, partial [Entrophospora sp. SA101]